MYIARSKKNVDDADGTLVFRLHSSPGTDKTIQYALTKKWTPWIHHECTRYKPTLVITDLGDSNTENNIEKIRSFIVDNNIKILNVAGHREPPVILPDFSLRITVLLKEALRIFK